MMGGIFSYFSKEKKSSEQSEIPLPLADMKQMDLDNDGKVTKQEFEIWAQKQKEDLEEYKTKIIKSVEVVYQKELSQQETEIVELKKQLKTLKSINEGLENKLKKEIHDAHSEDNFDLSSNASTGSFANKKLKLASDERIDQFVEELLTDENVNIKYFPDFVEKKLYKNIFNIALGIIDKLLESTSIQIIGHQITFDLNPIVAEEKGKDRETIKDGDLDSRDKVSGSESKVSGSESKVSGSDKKKESKKSKKHKKHHHSLFHDSK